MFDDKWRQRVRKGGRALLYVLIVVYLLVVLDDLNSIQSDISSIESDVNSIQTDVNSIQSDVSSIESNTEQLPTHSARNYHPRPRKAILSLRMSTSAN